MAPKNWIIFLWLRTLRISAWMRWRKKQTMQRWKSQTAVKHSCSNECCINVIKLFFHYSMSRSNITLEMCVNKEPLAVLWDMSEWLQPGKLLNSSKQWNRLCQCCWACINTDSNTHRLQTNIKMLHFTLTVYQICFRQRETQKGGGEMKMVMENCTSLHPPSLMTINKSDGWNTGNDVTLAMYTHTVSSFLNI